MPAIFKELKFAWDYFVLGRYRSANRADVAPWVDPPPLEAELWFGGLLVADLHRVFPHQGTWFSECHLKINDVPGELPNLLRTYIAFCEDFHRRGGEGKDHDFDEFSRFGSAADCESWSVRLNNGREVPMVGRIWFADGLATWQHPESPPSTEVSAHEFWMQNIPGRDAHSAKIEHENEGTNR